MWSINVVNHCPSTNVDTVVGTIRQVVHNKPVGRCDVFICFCLNMEKHAVERTSKARDDPEEKLRGAWRSAMAAMFQSLLSWCLEGLDAAVGVAQNRDRWIGGKIETGNQRFSHRKLLGVSSFNVPIFQVYE